MDRQYLYPGELWTDANFLQSEKNTMVALAHLTRAVFGVGPTVAGLLCAPTSPASMSVTVAPGSIYALTAVDATSYGSLGADTTDTIVKQGINFSTQTFSCPAPVTAGQSIVYLIEAAYTDSDAGNSVLTYFNSTNPAMPFTGPGNSGTSQPTVRQGLCSLQLVTGTPATSGSQMTPAPGSGYAGLYAITVAYGATTITAGNIAALTSAPFLPYTLPQLRPGFPQIQEFPTSGTFTVPAGVTTVKARVWGAGGGSGGIGSTSNGAAGGGGGGGHSEKRCIVTPGQTIAVTTGTGGAGGGPGGNGTTGGSSSFGSFCSATGGGPGSGNTVGNGGSGGIGSGGDVNMTGGGGTTATSNSGAAAGGSGGCGAAGGGGGSGALGVSSAGGFPGGGGGGPGSSATYSGAAGASGLVTVEY